MTAYHPWTLTPGSGSGIDLQGNGDDPVHFERLVVDRGRGILFQLFGVEEANQLDDAEVLELFAT